jgi:hypothetical protein
MLVAVAVVYIAELRSVLVVLAEVQMVLYQLEILPLPILVVVEVAAALIFLLL